MGRTGEDDQPEEVTNFHYDENTPPQPQPQPPPFQPVQFPPPNPEPQAYPPPADVQPPQAYHPQQVHPQAYAPPLAGMGYMASMGYDLGPSPPPFPKGQAAVSGADGWSSDLFDCMDNPENAIITACFPCVTYGQIAEIVDNGQSSCATSGFIYGLIAIFLGCPCIISCSLRSKLRSRYGLDESPAPDWVTHCFCEWCALCQEYRELTSQGLDPAIGWQGNVIKQQQNIQMQQQATMAPPMNQAMM